MCQTSLVSIVSSDPFLAPGSTESKLVKSLTGDARAAATLLAKEAAATKAVAQKILTAERIGKALKSDVGHRAASFASLEQLAAGKVFALKGGDGVQRTLLQADGVMNAKSGVFEYILNAKGQVEHQRFITGGKITGYPNQ